MVRGAPLDRSIPIPTHTMIRKVAERCLLITSNDRCTGPGQHCEHRSPGLLVASSLFFGSSVILARSALVTSSTPRPSITAAAQAMVRSCLGTKIAEATATTAEESAMIVKKKEMGKSKAEWSQTATSANRSLNWAREEGGEGVGLVVRRSDWARHPTLPSQRRLLPR